MTLNHSEGRTLSLLGALFRGSTVSMVCCEVVASIPSALDTVLFSHLAGQQGALAVHVVCL